MQTLIGLKTHFSLGESILSPKEIVKHAKSNGYECIAVSDTNSINGLVQLFQEAKNSPVKIVIGATFNVVDSLSWRRPKKNEKKTTNAFFRPSLYIKNQAGLGDVMHLLTKANDENHFYFKPQILLDELLEVFERGNVVMTSGTLFSVFTHKDYDNILRRIAAAENAKDFVLELSPIKTAYFDSHNQRVADSFFRYDFSAIHSMPALHKPEESHVRDTADCIIGNKTRNTGFINILPAEHKLPDVHEYDIMLVDMYRRIDRSSSDKTSLSGDACFNTENFADRFDYEWGKMDITLPTLYEKPFEKLKELCVEGFKKRVMKETLGYRPPKEELPAYKARLAYELRVLKSMGFEDYFLLVHYIVDWCKSQNIEVGPGRGSVGGSLVAYLIGITDVDPIRFKLFFERFINPERIDLPDIDLDFMSSRRQEVFDFLRDKFGEEYVAGISNYSMLGSASSLRGAAKVHGLKEQDYQCSKYIPKVHGAPMPLQEAVAEVAELENFALTHKWVWDEAVALQNTFRSYSQHAAGVIVAGVPIADRAVVETRTGSSVVNWDKRSVEDFGFVKLDILGLTTLDVLSHAKNYIYERHKIRLNLTEIPLDDEKVLNNFRKGKTIGVFQFESGGMRSLLKRLGEEDPLDFEDVTAATALYRPGPMESGLMERFVQIKQGNDEPSYLHENMKAALEPTYGVIVYQEQVMQLARDLAGFTMAESDHLRKAMGKKDPVKMAKQRDKWVDGCISHSGLDKDTAERLFDQIEAFAGYAFNRSHSVEYSIISYWAMYIKTYYPAEFYASVMNVLVDRKIAQDCFNAGIRIMPPDINRSTDRFEIVDDPTGTLLYTPFQLIKGLSSKASTAIIYAKSKNGKPFESKQEFIDTVVRRSCNIRAQERLDKVGAFAEIESEQHPATHHSRLKDQKELLPDTTVSSIKADRKIEVSVVKDGIKEIIADYLSCADCTLSGEPHPVQRLGQKAKVMIVMDCPNWSEKDSMKMGEGDASKPLKDALKNAGLGLKDVYITSLIKAPKPKGGKIENEMINGCSKYLQRELELLKPPVIVTMGGASSRYLLPELKGSWEEILLQEHYDAKKDATIVVGMNPMMVYFDSRKQTQLNEVFKKVSDLIT